MDYQNTLKYLYESVPMFQQIGGNAYKPGLETTHRLDEHFGHPQSTIQNDTYRRNQWKRFLLTYYCSRITVRRIPGRLIHFPPIWLTSANASASTEK